MSGWIDPLGTRALHRFIQAEQHRLEPLIAEGYRRWPKSRKLSKLRARYDELGKLHALIQAVERPGIELLPYKELVNVRDRHDLIDALVPRDLMTQ
jgi:hypothetical protein